MLNKSEIYTSSVRTNIPINTELLKTERQWALAGYIAINSNCGEQLWTNRFCNHKKRYLHKDEVRLATDDEIKNYFKPEREAKNKKTKLKNAKRKVPKLVKEICKSINIVNEPKCFISSDTIVIDVETTGLNNEVDELLQVSIINTKADVLYNSYIRPLFNFSWTEAQYVNSISPYMVKDSPTILTECAKINAILSDADVVIGYNTEFDLSFLSSVGCEIKNKAKVIDVMKDFAEIYGEWSEYYDNYKWQKLSTCAEYYGYNWGDDKAHDSLADCLATLYCYNKINDKK